MPAELAVTPSGALSYTLPIVVPPGTRGAEPRLALAYGSQAGNGLFGVGWSLSGLSAITRCAATVAHDGVRAGVDFSGSDRFCLDGQRLMVVSGSYGANGSVYRTAKETFAHITAHGRAGGGPAYFVVRNKDGQVLSYGATADSRVEGAGRADVLTWSLSTIADRRGNTVAFKYIESGSSSRPQRIDYTQNSKTGVKPFASVRFVYASRPDTFSGFVGGVEVSSNQIATQIQTYVGNKLLRDYRLRYDASPASGRSRLRSVQVCAESLCYPASRFDWTAGKAGWGAQIDTGRAAGEAVGPTGNRSLPIDVNGDGKTDLVFPKAGTWRVLYGTANGLSAEVATSASSKFPGLTSPFDYDQDGKADLLTWYNGKVVIQRSTGKNFTPVWTNIPLNAHSDRRRCYYDGGCNLSGTMWTAGLDVDGDGRQDIVVGKLGSDLRSRKGTIVLYRRIDKGFALPVVAGQVAEVGISAVGRDIDGDGRTDLIINGQELAKRGSTAYRSNGKGFSRSNKADKQHTFLHSVDLNGDGLADQANTYYGDWGFRLANGHPTRPERVIRTWGRKGYSIVADINGDGRQELLESVEDRFIAWKLAPNNTQMQIVETGISTKDISVPLVGDINGDGFDDLAYVSKGRWLLRLHHPASDLIAAIADPLKARTRISYRPATDRAVHLPGSGSKYPVRDVVLPQQLVRKVESDNGIGGSRTVEYAYGQAKVDLRGLGFLGFGWSVAEDRTAGIRTTTWYGQDYPFDSMVRQIERRLSKGKKLLSKTVQTLNLRGCRTRCNNPSAPVSLYPYVSQSVLDKHQPSGDAVTQTVSRTTIDDYGNPTDVRVEVRGGGTTLVAETIRTFDIDVGNWLVARPLAVHVSRTDAKGRKTTRSTGFSHNHDLLREERIAVGSDVWLKKSYGYDKHGNRSSETVEGAALVPRITRTDYEKLGRFVSVRTNALKQKIRLAHDPRHGKLTLSTDPNNLATRRTYDAIGRPRTEIRPDGTSTAWSYPPGIKARGGVYAVMVSPSGRPPRIDEFDALGRQVHRFVLMQKSPDRWSTVSVKYDARGFRSHVSEPYVPARKEAPQWTRTSYDALGRPLTIIAPDKGVTRVTYSWLTTTIVNAQNKTTRRISDPLGRVIREVNAKNEQTSYTYGPFGNLTQMVLPGGKQVLASYDLRGNRRVLQDPNLGRRVSVYDGLGQLRSIEDAKKQVISYSYDALGRLRTRTEPGGTTTWTYDQGNKAIGRLSRVVSPGYTRTHAYDAKGRPAGRTIRYGGLSYALGQSYDGSGRVDRLTYPGGFSVRHRYDNLGYLRQVVDGQSGKAYWTRQGFNGRGQITDQLLGNGLTTLRAFDPKSGLPQAIATNGGIQEETYFFDNLGRLERRTAKQIGRTETFAYDALNRLLRSTVVGGPVKAFTYDPLGNIKSKSDVGSYSYGARPHAVTSAGSATYGYDPNGNLISGAGRTIAYTPFNKPKKITAGGQQVAFAYDAERRLLARTDSSGTTVSIGRLYERVTSKARGLEQRYSIFAAGERIAIHVRGGGGRRATFYPHHDHLGSIVALTDGAGKLVKRFAFDAFGKRRNASNWSDAPDPKPLGSTETDRGFTGHTQLDSVGLVHMGGRVYDPALGRFLSPDPLVGGSISLQTINRYSYVLNNPLSLVDPSGYLFGSLFKGLKGALKAIGGLFSRNWRSIAAYTAAFVPILYPTIPVMLASGFVSGFIQGGTIRAGILGTITRVAQWPLGNAIAPALGEAGFTKLGLAVNALSSVDARLALIRRVESRARSAGAGTVDRARWIARGRRFLDRVGRCSLGVGEGEECSDVPVVAVGTASIGRGLAVAMGRAQTAYWTDKVRRATAGSSMETVNSGVSLPLIRRYVAMTRAGMTPPPIQAHGRVIQDGTHRYIAGRITGKMPEIEQIGNGMSPGTRVSKLRLSPKDWDKLSLTDDLY